MAPKSYQYTIRDPLPSPSPSPKHVTQVCNLVPASVPVSASASRPARPFFACPADTVPMSSTTPPDKAVRSLLNHVSPTLSVQELEAVPSARLQLLYNVKVSEGPNLLLTLPPPAAMRLLRSEESSIGSEAAVLKWLSEPVKDTSSSSSPSSSSSSSSDSNSPGKTPKGANTLMKYLPVLMRHGSSEGSLPVEYNLSRPPRGVAVSALKRPLSRRERRAVDAQIGQLFRRISIRTSPNRRFGLAADVLSVPHSNAQTFRFEGGLHETRGARSWSIAFHSLLESILRDGEDLAVMISYGAIRRHVHRFSHLLDAVKQPRLVVIDAGENVNTLVLRTAEAKTNSKKREPDGARRVPKPTPLSDSPESEEVIDDSEVTSSEMDDGEFAAATGTRGQPQIEVTGLRQWSHCIFGDPLIATIFTNNPSLEFWLGFDKQSPSDPSIPRSLIEDRPRAHVRLLLYECYHAVTAVVREFYRPQTNSNERELMARKNLANILAKLEVLDDEGMPTRRRRSSGEMSPSKRARQHDAEESD